MFFATLFSCGKGTETENTDDNNTDNKITQAQLDKLSELCMTEAEAIQLPTPLTLFENYSTNEYVAEIWAASNFSKAIITTFGNALAPTTFATVAEADNLNVFDGEEAYTWGVAPHKYTYIIKEDGYQILQFDDELDILGSEKIRVWQNEDCTSFEIVQRATNEDLDVEHGSVLFRMAYINQNVQKYDFSDLSNGDNRTYSMRSFDDLSGDLRITDTSDNSQLAMIWGEDGNGSWQLIQNNNEVDSGNWSF